MFSDIIKFFPLCAGVLMPVTFLISYAWAVSLGHVEADFPYISSTGAYPPESNFFSFMLNIVSFLVFVTVWARDRQIRDHCNEEGVSGKLRKLSEISIIFGYAAAIGICLLGNFQSSGITVVHVIGAVMAFGLGTVYLWFQSVISVSLVPRVNSHNVMVLRFVCSVLAVLMIIMTVIFSYLHDTAHEAVAYWSSDRDWWQPENRKRWVFHVLATSSEWILAGTFVVVLLTFFPEFKRITFKGVMIEYSRDRKQVRDNTHTHTQSLACVESTRL